MHWKQKLAHFSGMKEYVLQFFERYQKKHGDKEVQAGVNRLKLIPLT